MNIRTKLLLIIFFLTIPLILNLVVLGYLVQVITQSVQTIQEVSVRQQSVTLKMQAQLRDAEAALYRYQIEADETFLQRFDTLMNNFGQEITSFERLATSDPEQIWAEQLSLARQEAIAQGNDLVRLRDAQTADLHRLEEVHTQIRLLLNKVQLSEKSDAVAYQTATNSMLTDGREMLLSVASYLAAPDPADDIRFTDATLAYRFHQAQFDNLPLTPTEKQWSAELKTNFAEAQQLGASLIDGRDAQQEQFAQFANTLFQIGEEIIVDQIQPHAANNLVQAQRNLNATLNLLFTWSLIISSGAVVIALALALPLLRRMTQNFRALLWGADRVASGNLAEPVQVSSRDEMAYLGQTFNMMMADLAARESRLQQRISELETLREVNLQLTSILDLDHVFQTIVTETRQLVNAAEAHIFLHDEARNETRLQASDWRQAPRLNKSRAPRNKGLVMTALRSQEAQILNHAAQIPPYNTPGSPVYGLRATAAFPLKLADRALGVFHVALDDRDVFSEGELRILGMIADQAAVALENARLYESVADQEARLNELLQKLAIIQEEERRLVGLDLHDGLTQILLSANLHINTLSLLATQLDDPAQAELKMGQTRLQEAIEEANWVISELRPTELEDFGLVDGLRYYVTKVAQHEGWAISYTANLDNVEMPPAFETAIFRIVQEALSNARKYAQTDKVHVTLSVQGQALVAEVRDWGRGFEVGQLGTDRERLGLLGMQERAEMLGGALFIDSAPGQGTTILAAIPLLEAQKVVTIMSAGVKERAAPVRVRG